MSESTRKIAKKSDWKTIDMPKKTAHYTIYRKLSDADYENLKYGHIPQQMEDKWFWYFEDNKLYVHRSWTGFCSYILSFTPGSEKIDVIANRNSKQYFLLDDEVDAKFLNKLLDWWTQP